MIYLHEPIFNEHERIYTRVIADSEDELQEFGELIGLQAEWIRNEPRFHFEVYGTKLQLAISHDKIQYLTLREFEEYFSDN
jgi:hypothetical protein